MVNCKLKFWNDQPVLVTVLQITIFALLLLALIICLATLGVFGKHWEDTKDRSHDHVDVCFLFSSKNEFGKNSYCDFIAATHGIILIALLILLVVLAVIVFLRLSIGFDLVAFLVVAIVTVIFSLIASIVLSSGFAKTCSTVKDISSNIRCSTAMEVFGKGTYDALQSSTACSWIETCLIGAVVVIACIYAAMKMSRRSGYTKLIK